MPETPAVTSSPTTQSPAQIMTMLHDSLYPSQREWAAIKLANLDWKTNADVVQALLTGAREDPAPTVRAACVHALAKMRCNTMPVVTVIQGLKTDVDPRVLQEVEQAIAVLSPTSALSSAVQPASAQMLAPTK
jgi:hypothetical protein